MLKEILRVRANVPVLDRKVVMVFQIGDKVKILKGVYRDRIGYVSVLAGDDVPKRIGLRITKSPDESIAPYAPTWFEPDAIEKE